MRLMKSSFGHQYMVMGGWGTAFYPRDESMRFRGDPSGGRLTHAEMAQKVRMERCIGGRLQLGARDGGRVPIKGPSPVQERAAPDYGPVGSRRPRFPRGRALPPKGCPLIPRLLNLSRVRADRAEMGKAGAEPPDLHSREGSPFPIQEECQDHYSRQGRWTRCRGWPS
jgi:hypothetical protein